MELFGCHRDRGSGPASNKNAGPVESDVRSIDTKHSERDVIPLRDVNSRVYEV
jgi:hypothetical protein